MNEKTITHKIAGFDLECWFFTDGTFQIQTQPENGYQSHTLVYESNFQEHPGMRGILDSVKRGAARRNRAGGNANSWMARTLETLMLVPELDPYL